MKVRALVITLAVLLAILVLTIALTRLPGPAGAGNGQLDLAAMDSLEGEALDKALAGLFSSSELPKDQEKAFLAWLFIRHPGKGESLVRENAQKIANLPWHIGDTALSLVKARQSEAGLRLLALGRQLYPNDPDITGISGVVAFLAGNKLEARRLLEAAESWRQNRPIVDFYLGGILVTSEKVADLTRGKKILMQLVGGTDPELQELAGLTLLTNTRIPMIRDDIVTTYTRLDEAGVFHLDNPNLSADALRIITNRLVPVVPEEAMQLAELLLTYPGTQLDDRLGLVQLAQSMRQTAKAGEFLDPLEDDRTGLDAAQQARLDRLLAVQHFQEEAYDEGLEALRGILAGDAPDFTALQETFSTLTRGQLPMDTERQLLRLYLQMPVQEVVNSIQVVRRLVSIDPLQEQTWIDYAMDQLFEKNPLLVGEWLTTIGATEVIAAALEGRDTLTSDESLLLVNTYLDQDDPAQAQALLDSPRASFEAPIRPFLQCRVLLAEGKPEEAAVYWEEAHQAILGSNRYPLLKSLGFLAIELNQPVNAMQSLYTALAAGIPFNPGQAGQLLELTLKYGNLQQSIEVAEYLAASQPGSPVAQNNLAYFKFLAESSVDESLETMRKLVEEYPDIHQFSLTLALGLIKSGRTNEANRLIQSTNIDWNNTSNRGRLIYAVVLAATNQRVVADGLIANLDMADLIPEEKALLEAF